MTCRHIETLAFNLVERLSVKPRALARAELCASKGRRCAIRRHTGASLALALVFCAASAQVATAAAPSMEGDGIASFNSMPSSPSVQPTQIDPTRLRPLPSDVTVYRHYPSGSADGPTVAQPVEDDGKLIYSNTFGQYVLRPGAGTRVADDLVTEAFADAENPCYFDTLRVRVNGGVEGGEGEFLAVVRLWDGCPGGNGEMIPGTQGIFLGLPDDSEEFHELVIDFADRGICDDSSECSVSEQDCADMSVCVEDPIVMPPTVWLQVWFNTSTAGIVYGSPAQRGFSADNFDHPLAPCFSWFGGWPRFPHASFWAQITADSYCPVHFLAYLAADPTRPAYIPPTNASQTRIGDDITLILGDGICELSAYELGIIGSSGPYEMDVDLRWPDIYTAQEATHNVFTGRGEGSLDIAHFAVPAGLFIGPNDQPIFITWQPNRGGTGVPLVYETLVGESGPTFVMKPPGEDWAEYALGAGKPAVFHAAIYCRGETPTGACCPDQPAEPGGEMVCMDDVSVLGCLGSRWLIDSTCADNEFNPPCGTHKCCLPSDNCEDLTYDDCMAECQMGDDPIPCFTDDDCPGPRTCEPDNYCSPKCARWTSGTFCDEVIPGEMVGCPPFECFDALGDCYEDEPEIVCDDDFDCPPGRSCIPLWGICSARKGCNHLECCADICNLGAAGRYCCEVFWDTVCVALALQYCEYAPGNDECYSSSEGEGAIEIEWHECADDQEPCTEHSTCCSGRRLAASNEFATNNYDEDPGFCCNKRGIDLPGEGTIWFTFIAPPHATSAVIHTCNTPGSATARDSIIQVFEALDHSDAEAECNSLQIIGCNDDAPNCGGADGLSSICVTNLTPGEKYYILMASSTGITKGQYRLDIESPCPVLPPFGTTCASAELIGDGYTEFSLVGATIDCPAEPSEPKMMNDIWFTYFPGTTGNLLVETCSPNPPDDDPATTLAVYQGTDCPPTLLIGHNDDADFDKLCTYSELPCNSGVECIVGCSGTGAYCVTDEDCPGTSTCDTAQLAYCGVSGTPCTEDTDCDYGVCTDDYTTPCSVAAQDCAEPWECVRAEECVESECLSECGQASHLRVPIFAGQPILIRLGGENGGEPEGWLHLESELDDCQPNGLPDLWEITTHCADGTVCSVITGCADGSTCQSFASDCNLNGEPDDCDIATLCEGGSWHGMRCTSDLDCPGGGTCGLDSHSGDCDENGVPDECQIDVDSVINCRVCEGGSNDGGSCGNDLQCPGGTCTGWAYPCSEGPFFCVIDCDPDVDMNGIPDACEFVPDEDGDGVPDAIDNCPEVPNSDQADADTDSVGDACDNCPDNANLDQTDTDGDRRGDVCDNCPTTWNPRQVDANNDGIGDACQDVWPAKGIPHPGVPNRQENARPVPPPTKRIPGRS